jgi:hypothetical protein
MSVPSPCIECFIVRDANGHALPTSIARTNRGRRSAAHLMTRDEARRIACSAIHPLSDQTADIHKPTLVPLSAIAPYPLVRSHDAQDADET